MSSKIKKPATITTATGPKFDKDGYSRGPNMKLGRRMPDDFLPPPEVFRQMRKNKHGLIAEVSLEPSYFAILEREASRRRMPQKEFMSRILEAHAEILR